MIVLNMIVGIKRQLSKRQFYLFVLKIVIVDSFEVLSCKIENK